MYYKPIILIFWALISIIIFPYSGNLKAEGSLFAAEVAENRFALHATWNNTEESRDLGVDLIRGIYHFDISEQAERNWISIYQSAGLNIVLTITPTAKTWSNAVISNIGLGRVPGKKGICGFPADLEGYKRDLRRLIENIDGDGINDYPELRRPIKYIQVGNEIWWQWFGNPPKYIKNLRQLQAWKIAHLQEVWRSYGEFLKITYETIKAENPDIIVIQGSLFDEKPMTSHEKMLLDEYSNFFDIIDIHFYGNHVLLDEIPKLKEVMREVKKLYPPKPIFCLEIGGPMQKDPFDTAEEIKRHAEEVVKIQVVAFEKGVDKAFWSSLVPTIGWPQSFLNTALLEVNTFSKKPAYYTYKILNNKINYFKSVSRIVPNEYFYKFEFKNKNPVFVLWSKSGQRTIDLSSFIPSPNVKMTYIITEQGKTDRDAKVEIVPVNAIRISETPIFAEEL